MSFKRTVFPLANYPSLSISSLTGLIQRMDTAEVVILGGEAERAESLKAALAAVGIAATLA